MQGVLLIAAGFLLLWIVASGRTANLSAGWNALLNGSATTTPPNAAPPVSSALTLPNNFSLTPAPAEGVEGTA